MACRHRAFFLGTTNTDLSFQTTSPTFHQKTIDSLPRLGFFYWQLDARCKRNLWAQNAFTRHSQFCDLQFQAKLLILSYNCVCASQIFTRLRLARQLAIESLFKL
jgi:hypothetical protein